jgi:hypothetical protein
VFIDYRAACRLGPLRVNCRLREDRASGYYRQRQVLPNEDNKLRMEKLVERIAKWLTELARLCAIVFFLYCAYVGVFQDGGSTMVFVGVLALFFTLVICYFLEQIPKAVGR